MYRTNKKKCYCAFCHREIKWVRNKETSRSVPVEPDSICFIPDESGHQLFVDQNGDLRRGRMTPDGLRGYRKHNCPAMPIPVHNEKYLKSRQWA